mmetsp:Transcript_18811/g.26669  ORF Transcript_18811/g.26669 Transcript_18811/m.26669 type:complete len:105 (+) Transcript_18811:2736-3050(+)
MRKNRLILHGDNRDNLLTPVPVLIFNKVEEDRLWRRETLIFEEKTGALPSTTILRALASLGIEMIPNPSQRQHNSSITAAYLKIIKKKLGCVTALILQNLCYNA